MSFMFKKKGGLAFKPKIPSTRPRPAAPAASVPSTNSIESEPVAGSSLELKAPLQPRNAIPSSDAPKRDSTKAAEPLSEPAAVTVPSNRDVLIREQASPAEPQSPVTETPVVLSNTVGAVAASNAAEELGFGVLLELACQPNHPVAAIAQHNIAPELRDEQYIGQDACISTAEQTTNTAQSQDPSPVTPADTEAVTILAPQRTGPKPRGRRKSLAAAAQETDDDDGGAEARPKKRQRKTPQGADGTAIPRPRRRKAGTQNGPSGQTTPKRVRSVTPEDAETQVVDLQKLKMTDLTKDLHIGKKFSRHDELRARERQARMRAKLKKSEGDASREASEAPETETPSGDHSSKTKSATPAAASTPAAPAASSGPQFRIVDGQIIVDQSSLVMDRHARAAATRDNMETVEENDFTQLITSSSFMNTSKLKGPNIWTDEETELFYRGLRMFGTDFEMISKMFPNKQRRHAKLKYNREERHCPQRISAAVTGVKTIKMDIDEYKAFTGIEFEPVEAIEAEQRKIQEGFEAEQKRIADEQAEIMRKKREELFADEEGNENDTSTKKKKAKKKGKQVVQYGLNGEPILPEDS